ncbi:hypothetical protein MFFC18_03320 [Mariniblastus fucicola]|uniref:Uncharacterized protein n=1 Tax=Mariniblastus fucicola TaxID=980251 RepID=A0A5B9P2V3_9BACT|nr:hypothetical protein MFFC18_03320 [Mariniblastus fucicola]
MHKGSQKILNNEVQTIQAHAGLLGIGIFPAEDTVASDITMTRTETRTIFEKVVPPNFYLHIINQALFGK